MFGNNKISLEEREKEFLGVEGMVTVADAEPGQFSHYVPTPMSNVRTNTGLSIIELTKAKRKHGMYPIQRTIAKLFGFNKSNHA